MSSNDIGGERTNIINIDIPQTGQRSRSPLDIVREIKWLGVTHVINFGR